MADGELELNVWLHLASPFESQMPAPQLRGFHMKPLALVHSAFDEVIMADADNMFFVYVPLPPLFSRGAVHQQTPVLCTAHLNMIFKAAPLSASTPARVARTFARRLCNPAFAIVMVISFVRGWLHRRRAARVVRTDERNFAATTFIF